jgi:hypothetical protein
MSSPLYIDPTTGGLGLQILLGFFVGGFVTIKLMWSRFLSMLPFVSKSEEPEDEPSTTPQPVVED